MFKVQEVSDLEFSASVLKPGALYELRTKHPLIDYVGYLRDSNNVFWLVFIQVSLQNYKDHTPMSDIFHKPPSKRSVPRELKGSKKHTLYSFYLNLAKITEDQEANVIFLYVSPEETDASNVLPLLQMEIKKAKRKQKMNVGVLTKLSKFFTTMMEFSKQ